MNTLVRPLVGVLVVLNLVVLLGQVWPEGAPPFARTVNIVFLAGNLAFLVGAFRHAGGARAS